STLPGSRVEPTRAWITPTILMGGRLRRTALACLADARLFALAGRPRRRGGFRSRCLVSPRAVSNNQETQSRDDPENFLHPFDDHECRSRCNWITSAKSP